MRIVKRVLLALAAIPLILAALFFGCVLFWPDGGLITRQVYFWQRCTEAREIYRDALRGGEIDYDLRRDYQMWCDR